MKPARRARSGFQRTRSSATDSAAVAAIPAATASSIDWCSGPLTPNVISAPNAIRSPYAKLTRRRIP
jgi:hypothetical protein